MSSRRRWSFVAVLSAALLGGAAFVEHARTAAATDRSADCSCAGQQVVDPTLLAFLGKARAAHHRADLLQEDGDLDLAIEALDPVVKAARPAAPEAAEVVADTFARIADLRSDLGDFEPAMRDVEAGLAIAPGATHFRGHLLEMKGVVLERRYHALESMGEVDQAAQIKAQALDAFKSAIDVQEQVINDALSHGKR